MGRCYLHLWWYLYCERTLLLILVTISMFSISFYISVSPYLHWPAAILNTHTFSIHQTDQTDQEFGIFLNFNIIYIRATKPVILFYSHTTSFNPWQFVRSAGPKQRCDLLLFQSHTDWPWNPKYNKNANVTLENAMRLVLSLPPNHPPTSASTKLYLTKVKMEISRRFTKNLVKRIVSSVFTVCILLSMWRW